MHLTNIATFFKTVNTRITIANACQCAKNGKTNCTCAMPKMTKIQLLHGIACGRWTTTNRSGLRDVSSAKDLDDLMAKEEFYTNAVDIMGQCRNRIKNQLMVHYSSPILALHSGDLQNLSELDLHTIFSW